MSKDYSIKNESNVNSKRLVDVFCDLVRTDSTFGKERQMADLLIEKLTEMGYEPYEDNSGEAIGGNAGNVITKIPGTIDAAPLLLWHIWILLSQVVERYP